MPVKNKTGKRGAPQGNFNSVRNGTRIVRLALGQLPPAMSRVTRYCRDYRRALEEVVADANHGQLTMTQAHLVDAACTHEQHAKVCLWLLRQRIDKMTTADIRETSRQIAASKDARNKAIAALGLDRDRVQDAIDVLYALPAPEEKQ